MLLRIASIIFIGIIKTFVFCKEPLNIKCTLDPVQITVEIFVSRPLYNVQLKNADRTCDPQEFTPNSIKFVIQNYQLGMCGFVRSDSSTDGLDGTFWNNLIWKEKPTSNKTKTTKIKCTHKMSAILSSAAQLIPMPVRVQVIHLPFGAFPSAFNGDAAPPISATSSNPGSEMRSPFPPGISPLGSGVIMVRSRPLRTSSSSGPGGPIPAGVVPFDGSSFSSLFPSEVPIIR
ncbi:uncharacterized protein LOC129583304 [Paramacrobiotus metropolitanus]|uniref:uncharacterized protein LOC129583304 n=1 Tax=Paramacrobiotus metropolitanus TaxID=2943436 RepID=UPI0024459189|nr:uncharacterized protein LOC129583304 [Paramacrobiotus metropolitanus]